MNYSDWSIPLMEHHNLKLQYTDIVTKFIEVVACHYRLTTADGNGIGVSYLNYLLPLTPLP